MGEKRGSHLIDKFISHLHSLQPKIIPAPKPEPKPADKSFVSPLFGHASRSERKK